METVIYHNNGWPGNPEKEPAVPDTNNDSAHLGLPVEPVEGYCSGDIDNFDPDVYGAD